MAEECWPDSAQAEVARRILPDYLRLGPAQFVANADVEMQAMVAGDQVIPVVYARPGDRRAPDVCSTWSHYVRYPGSELDRGGSRAGALIKRGLLAASRPLLRFSRIDEVVSVNNWLLSTNPAPSLDRAAVESLTARLCEQAPGRAIVFRTVNPATNPDLAEALTGSGYRMVAARTVYVLDPTSRPYRQSENARRDRKLLSRGDYEIAGHDDLSPADMPRLAELHRALYVEKYTALNPEFSPLFFETAWRNGFFEFQALRKDGRIDAYIAFYEWQELLVASLLGYDTRLPAELGLYRRGVALMTKESRRRGLRLHLSAGAGQFKYLRGARPCIEYDAIFDRHLPLRRRAGWTLLQMAGTVQQRKVRRGW